MRDWLPEDHLVWFVLDVVSNLDISEIEAAVQEKDARGQRPYDPRMMVALLVYAYSSGVYSSRRMTGGGGDGHVAPAGRPGGRRPPRPSLLPAALLDRRPRRGAFASCKS